MARDMKKYSEAKPEIKQEKTQMMEEEKLQEVKKEPSPLISQMNPELVITSKKLASIINGNFNNRVQNRTDYMKNTHMRTSFLFDKDVKDKLDAVAKDKDRGWKTQFINDAIEFALEGFEVKTEDK